MSDISDKAFSVLGDRSVWENRQRAYFLMRHDGLRRQNKPFPNAADSTFPMIDMNISKWKPFWLAQAFANERLAAFKAMRQQLEQDTEAAADYFDFELKQRTNFEEELECCIDTMLLRGRGVLKITCDPHDKYAIKFTAIDPMFILMAQQYNDFDDADWWVEVQRLTVPQYKRNRNYSQAPDVLAAIRGKRDYNFEAILLDKQLREGITHSTNEDEIILWHQWEKSDLGWIIHTYSPQAQSKVIRQPIGCVYEVQGKPSCPYISFTMEVKDKGWYAPRGVAELCAAFQAYATKLWNEKSDAMTFGNRPLFTSTDNSIQNTGNLRFVPGEFIPGNIQAVQMPQPAYSFDQEINFTRQVSEGRLMMPDFGVTEDGTGEKRTATENNRISSLNNIGVDHNGRIFRRRLCKAYKHTWGLIVQFKERDLAYFMSDNLKKMPEQALHDEYLVQPDGSPDGWDKTQRLNRALQRLAAFKGAPNVDQDGLVKDVLAADDARLISKLLIPMNQRQAEEAYQEDVEITVLSMGRPVPVLPGQDHATRIMELLGFLHKQIATGAQVDPIAAQRIKEHLAQHFQFLQQLNPQGAKQLKQQIMQAEQQPGAQGQEQPPQGAGQQMPQTEGTGTSGTATEEKTSISIKLSDLYPSERAQFLQSIGIKAAGSDEMMQVEQARAHIKAISAQAKPKVEGAMA